MAFWSGETLLARGQGVFSNFNPAQIDCNSYKLCIGNQYYRTADHDKTSNNSQIIVSLSDRESFYIPPGQFAFLISKEKVKIPKNTMAFISMRTPIKLRGLINVSGFNVDPGYEGNLVYAVYNASPSPIYLKEGEPAFKIWLCAMDRTSKHVFDPGRGLHEITNDMVHGMNRDILSLQSMADKIDAQERDIERRFAEQKPVIDNLTQVWRTIVLGVIGALIIAILTIALTVTIPSIWNVGKIAAEKLVVHLKPEQANLQSSQPAAAPPTNSSKP